ncbi:MAG: L-threonylcarbamoyladenylate synthase [Candidatus Acidiferrales bacterium]
MPAELLKVSADAPDPATIRYAVGFIGEGQVIGIPTDTFYGLAADPFNLAAVQQIYRVKGRPDNRALPILVNSVAQAATLARALPESFYKLAKKFWPGGMTLVLEASNRLPLKVTGHTGRVALRWPNSRVACALIDQFEGPITGTSANISGSPSCSSGDELMEQLGARLPLVLDAGETGVGLASTIVSLSEDKWHIVREGLVPEADIRDALS